MRSTPPQPRRAVRTFLLLACVGLAGLALAEAPAPAPPAPLRVAEGAQLSAPPRALPTAPIPDDTDPIDLAGERLRQGNLVGATTLLDDWLSGKLPDLPARDGRQRWYAARFLLGGLELRQGHYNKASAQFTKVRAQGGALAAEAAWFEALTDHLRGRHAVAARECARYRERWPSGRHHDDCLLLEGDALTAAGTYQPAHDAYQAFIDLDPEGPDAEIARLGQALALINRSHAKAVPELQAMALDYSYPTTRGAALEALEAIATESLDTAIPDERSSRMRLAFSALRARDYSEARRLIAALEQDPEAQSWLTEHRETFGWRTRDYEALETLFAERYAANPSADTAWLAHRAAARGALWDKAATWGELGMKEHAGHWRWRRAADDVAWALMLSGELERAQHLWDRIASQSGGRGRQGAWFGAFCAWRAGDHADATARLEKVRGQDSSRATRALYYLGRVAEAQGQQELAQQRYRLVLEEDPQGWYGLLAGTRLDPQGSGPAWLLRSGDWPYARPEAPTGSAPLAVVPPPAVVRPPPSGQLELPTPRTIGWSALSWSTTTTTTTTATATATASTTTTQATTPTSPTPGEIPPLTVVEGRYYDAEHARQAFQRFATRHRGLFPELDAVYQLAEVGAYDLAGELMAAIFDEIEQGWRGRGPRAGSMRGVQMGQSDWRELFLFCRAWHLVSRYGMGLDKYADSPEEQQQALALAYPAAFPEHVWRSAREHDIDPLLVLSVMRQESHYKSWAVSSADAQGLMQILPVTGAGIARDLGVERYSPRDLLDPATNIRFGSWYLQRLITRFQGSLPLAVAAYNAGPHQASDWLAAQEQGLPVDDYVEMIPVDETRGYVRRVLGFYHLHTQIHGPEGARVALGLVPRGDDASVIDY